MQFIGYVVVLLGLLLASPAALAKTRYYDFEVKETSYTRLCKTKNILTVNGLFPGPTIYARKHDTIIVKVHNKADHNFTIHWHGVTQPRNPWSDGPEYVTQCPIQPGASFTQKILLTEEEGTLWWHAHSDWSRATLYGAIIIHPETGTKFPFPTPDEEIPIILGEWWNMDMFKILDDLQSTGGAPAVSDAYTINGQPGDLLPCSAPETFTVEVVHGKIYLLRIVNAAMNAKHFFGVAGHNLTLVGTDGSYTKPFTTNYIMIGSGQTMDLLLHANVNISSNENGRFYMAAYEFNSVPTAKSDDTTTTAIIQYQNTNTSIPPLFPTLPSTKDFDAAADFRAQLRSLANKDHPVNVPTSIDHRIFITVSLNLLPCPANTTCQGRDGERFSASLSNISFVNPGISILQAYYNNISGVSDTNFPDRPPLDFNFTADDFPDAFLTPTRATEVKVLEYNSTVEVVFQVTNLLSGMDHPMHLHGYSFYVVGTGDGNYNETRDSQPCKEPFQNTGCYNLVDPPFQNTVVVPKNGWAAIRFRANNPGVWFMHCHFELHATWGMNTVFIVKNGPTPATSMLSPPFDMPAC